MPKTQANDSELLADRDRDFVARPDTRPIEGARDLPTPSLDVAIGQCDSTVHRQAGCIGTEGRALVQVVGQPHVEPVLDVSRAW